MRGKLSSSVFACAIARITPAHAGKTYMRQQNTTITKDHPRACGENEDRITEESAKAGSPPRMRGKPSRSEDART